MCLDMYTHTHALQNLTEVESKTEIRNKWYITKLPQVVKILKLFADKLIFYSNSTEFFPLIKSLTSMLLI